MEDSSNTREIALTHGFVSLVDDEDYGKVSQFDWHAKRGSTRRAVWYAAVSLYKEDAEKIGKRFMRMHQLILGFPEIPLVVDHINGDGLDNRRQNLRLADRSQNCMNCSPLKNCSSKFKGVGWHKRVGKWQARICAYGKSRYVGHFSDEIEAALAYDREAINLHGEYAVLNFPKPDS